MATLLSGIVLPKQVIGGRLFISPIPLPKGAKWGQLSCPNINPAHLTDPTKQLQIDVQFSTDAGATWREDCTGGLWQGNADGISPGGWGTSVDPSLRDASPLVRASVNDFGTDVETDIAMEITD